MTVLTLPAQHYQDSNLRPVPWRRMLWVTWRQHRTTLISVPAVFGMLAVFLLIAGLKIHHDYGVLSACHPASSNTCANLNTQFNHTDWTLANTVHILLNLAPALVGAFVGAPVLARELETGTYRYAWTQGFGRERWTVVKLVLLAAAVTAAAGAFSQVFTWFFQPFLKQEDLTVLSAGVFATHDVAFAAWTLVAFAIGALAGMLIRRIVPAMATTLAVYAGLDIVTWLFLRKHYLPAVVTNNASFDSGPLTVNSPWVLSTRYTGPGGKPLSQSTINQLFQHYHFNGPEAFVQLLTRHGFTQWTTYIPVSRFWPMQFIEGGWLLVLSALLIAATVWLVRHRAA